MKWLLPRCIRANAPGLALALALALPSPAALARSDALQGVVTQVIDGGSLRFTPPGQAAITVRVRDMDPPEPCQPGGPEAKAALAAMVLNKPATLQGGGRDAQGRTVGVLVVDGVNVARHMVEEGHAWSVRTRNDAGPLVKQERMAKALGRGLHATAGAVMPRDWRRAKGACPAAATAARQP